ncbi:hypothetical protein HPB48_024979 [Haemaphysalis longicornis]|uniref:Uncharacterized protein n=1 Tax=Haemaphysalis longicornis TaxID=44386 RepID=A0A9J6H6U2_HAELO|nr:hypothetical protein HPB48_024979 [Haemaphysalis longicornis]
MHPERNVGRRKARGACLLRLISNKNQRVSFVDASLNEEREAFTVVVVDNEGTVANAASVRTDRPEVAEQAALALVDRSRPFVYSDSKSAVRAFEKGSVAKVALRIMKTCEIFQHYLCWFPAHLGVIEGAPLNLNESAHAAARDLTLRSVPRHGVTVLPENRDPLPHTMR